MIHVIAEIEVFPGKRDEFVTEFKRIVPIVRDEDGCLEYAPAIDHPQAVDFQPERRENIVTVVEKWSSVAALQAHLSAPHMVDYLDRVAHLRKGVRILVLDPA